MKMGMKVPTIRIPCMFKSQISFLPLSEFQDRKCALCCLSDITETDAWLLESQAQEFEQSGAALAIMVSTDTALGRDWIRPPQDFDIPFFIDPINRLKKMLRLTPSLRLNRCETLIFDQDQRLKFRLIHDLNLKGISAVLDIMKSAFLQVSPENICTPSMTIHSFLQTTGPKIPIETIS